MIVPAILVVAAATYWLGGGNAAETESPAALSTARAAIEPQFDRAKGQSSEGAVLAPDRSTRTGADSIADSTDSVDEVGDPLGSLIWPLEERRADEEESSGTPVSVPEGGTFIDADDGVVRQGRGEKVMPSGGMTITQTNHDPAEAAELIARRSADPKLDIRRLGYIELNGEEAQRLGIKLTDSSLELYADDLNDAQLRIERSDDRITVHGYPEGSLRRFRLSIDRSHSRFEPVKVAADASPLPIAPVVIVNQSRRSLVRDGSTLIYFKEAPSLARLQRRGILIDKSYEKLYAASRAGASDEDLRRLEGDALLGRLVPVYFWLDEGFIEGTDVRKGAEICLWYAPTREFIAALPERYRSSLETELTTIRQVADANGTMEEACDRIAGKPSYLEVCRVSSGAVNTAVATPNPAHGRTTVGFRLNESRHVSITLHDVNGRYLRHLLYEEERSAGEQRFEVDLKGVSQGAYLVAVRTSQGEQAVARLIVR